jgi:rhamnosyltransferase
VRSVSVAIPVLDGGERFSALLSALAAQDAGPHEVVVCDSGSRDGSDAVAERSGARVLRIDRRTFGHGRTRNLLMRETTGEVVAFLTQDAVPLGPGWLSALIAPFADEAIALACGPYAPRPGARFATNRELAATFAPMADPPGTTTVYGPRDLPRPLHPGPATFHTDANGALRRTAWEEVPFRDVRYAEDHVLAIDLLRAGWSRAFVPDAVVEHSHDYPFGEAFRRLFDEFRALREVYGFRPPVPPRAVLGGIRRRTAADRAWARAHGLRGAALDRATVASLLHHGQRAAALVAGTRADALPRPVRRWCSRDGIADVTPLGLDR